MSDKIKTANVDTDELDPTTVIGSGVYPSLGELTRYGGVHYHSQDKEEPIYGGVQLDLFNVVKTDSGYTISSKEDSPAEVSFTVSKSKVAKSSNHKVVVSGKITFEGTEEEMDLLLNKLNHFVV